MIQAEELFTQVGKFLSLLDSLFTILGNFLFQAGWLFTQSVNNFRLMDGLGGFKDVFMSDSKQVLNPVTVLAALGNGQRLQIVGLMSHGEALTINGLVQSMGRSYRAVHKDMDVLYDAGAVAVRYAEDGRVGLFYIPDGYRPQPGVVDYGFCAVRFGDAAKVLGKNLRAKD